MELTADCANCFGLCCVALPFTASADFAASKDAGQPCRHLLADDRCGIHDRLRERGFPGCVTFDCFGAGQRVSQLTYGGRGWRGDPARGTEMFAVFGVQRRLHELLWYLSAALAEPAAQPLHGELRACHDRTVVLTTAAPRDLLALDGAHAAAVGALLDAVSARVRGKGGRDRAGADLVGARLARADLRAANLRGALLLGANLRGADLRRADVLGADFRGADVRGARLAGALFLTRPQVAAAKGDRATTVPDGFDRPAHWFS